MLFFLLLSSKTKLQECQNKFQLTCQLSHCCNFRKIDLDQYMIRFSFSLKEIYLYSHYDIHVVFIVNKRFISEKWFKMSDPFRSLSMIWDCVYWFTSTTFCILLWTNHRKGWANLGECHHWFQSLFERAFWPTFKLLDFKIPKCVCLEDKIWNSLR